MIYRTKIYKNGAKHGWLVFENSKTVFHMDRKEIVEFEAKIKEKWLDAVRGEPLEDEIVEAVNR
jgi:hypothetical protein